MSRSNYSDDCHGAELNLWRGAVNQSIKGRRGQAFIRELIGALDALPTKTLIGGSFVGIDGEVCALGAVAMQRRLNMAVLESLCFDYDVVDTHSVAEVFGVANAMACEIMFVNDEEAFGDGAGLFTYMRAWAQRQLVKP